MKRTTFLASLFAPLVACFAQEREVSASSAGSAAEPQKEPVTPNEQYKRAFEKALKDHFSREIESYLPPCPGCGEPTHVRVFFKGDDWLCDGCFFAKVKADPASHREMVSVGWAEPVDIQDGDRLIFDHPDGKRYQIGAMYYVDSIGE